MLAPPEFIRLRGRVKGANKDVLLSVMDRCFRCGWGDGGPKPEMAEDLIGHRRLPDKKTVKHRLAVLEKKKAWDKRRTKVRFGLLRALSRLIERDFSFHAGADIFKPGHNIKVVFAAELVIHAEIFIHHRFLFYDEKVKSGEFFLHKIELVLGVWDFLTYFFKKQTVVSAKRNGAPRHCFQIKLIDTV